MIILGLDLGGKRIGVAKTDALGMMAHPFGILERRSDEKTSEEILELVRKHQVGRVVIGLPKNMDGSSGKAAQDALSFGEMLRKKLIDADLVYWDERLSTCAVERAMSDAGISTRDQRKKVDTLAAQWILQGYMSSLPKSE